MSSLHLSQAKIARRLGWSQAKMSKVLNGKMDLTVDDLEAICLEVHLYTTEAVRDTGREFCAELTPSELQMLERFRELPDDAKTAFMHLLRVPDAPVERISGKRKPIIPRGRPK